MRRLLLMLTLVHLSAETFSQTGHPVISQVYGGGGNTGALFKDDFIELFNPTASSVDLNGYSLQYASATSGNWSSNKVNLTGSLLPGKYFLVQLTSGGTSGSDLPAPDQASSNIILSAAAGKVALVNSTAALSGNCPDFSSVIDFVGFGAADCKEAQPAPSPGTIKSLLRVNNGCTDLDNNFYDFSAGAPSPRNGSSPANLCNGSSIIISNISGLPFCVDGTSNAGGTVTFQAAGIFPSTTFTAYLSDANGSFTASAAVGSKTVSGTNPSGSITITIPATNISSVAYRLRIDAESPSITGIQSGAIEIINGAKNVSDLTTSPNTGELTLYWTNPAGCYDEVMIVAKQGAPVSLSPSGDGASYVSDADFTGTGSVLDGGKVVYKGTANSRKVTGLADGTTYFFTAFTRNGTKWSNGIAVSDQPRLMPLPGEIVINQVNPGYSAVTDEYIELVNTTGKTFDLSELAIRYQAGSGHPGVAGGTLSGTLPPHSFWLLSPKAVITIGQTDNLVPDGFFEDGFAATSGQVALIRKTDNAVLDAVGYGNVTNGDYSEGAAAAGPSSDGGIKRVKDGADNDNNRADFFAVNKSSIDLRNSTSRLANNGASVAPGSYLRVYVTGNASLAGDVSLTGKVVIIDGKLSLGNHHLSTPVMEGGSSSGYIRTGGNGTLTIKGIGSETRKIAIGNSTYNPLTIGNGNGLDWNVQIADHVLLSDTGKTVSRTWHITPSSGVTSGVNLVFEYSDEGGQTGSSFNKSEAVQVWNYHADKWQSAGLSTIPTGVPGGTRTVALTNWTQFSPFVISNVSITLPVRFTNVVALQKKNSIELRWTNFTETNVYRYEIDRSTDGKRFVKLVTIAPLRNDGGKADYSYHDAGHLTGTIYYRVKAVEVDGAASYSRVVAMGINTGASRLVIAPNPVKGNQLNMRLDNLPAGAYGVQLYDTKGGLVLSAALQHAGGSVNYPVNLPNIPAGNYSLIITGKSRLQQVITVQK